MYEDREIICRHCGNSNNINCLFCRKCGFSLAEEKTEPETKLVLNPEYKPGITKGIFKMVGTGLLVFLLFSIGDMIFLKRHSRNRYRVSRQRACYANMRVILGAVEMYNMDHSDMITDLYDKDVSSKDGILIQGGYLKAPISKPDSNCSYSGKNLDSDGTIECLEHGTVEGD